MIIMVCADFLQPMLVPARLLDELKPALNASRNYHVGMSQSQSVDSNTKHQYHGVSHTSTFNDTLCNPDEEKVDSHLLQMTK